MKCKIKVRAQVFPTEESDKVIKSILNIFNLDDVELGDGYVLISGCNDLNFFKEKLEERNIREVARRICMRGMDDEGINFKISKQAAYVGKVNLVEDEISPLGELEVYVQSDHPEQLIEWLCEIKS